MKKTIMFIIMLAVCLLVVPSAYAASEYPTVTDATKSDSLLSGTEPVVENSETDTVTVRVDGGTFKILGAQSGGAGSLSRPDGYTWIGLHFVMPEGTKEETIKFGSGNHETIYKNEGFDEYFGFKTEELQAAVASGETLTQTYTLKWQNESSEDKEQKINIIIDLENVVIIQKEGNEQTWNRDIYHEEKGDVKISLRANCPEEVGDNYNDVMYIPANSKLAEKDVRALASLKEYLGTKYEVEGFYSDDAMTKKFNFSNELADDTTVFIKLTAVKKETNPATGDNLLTYVALSVVALTGVLGTGLYLRKVNA